MVNTMAFLGRGFWLRAMMWTALIAVSLAALGCRDDGSAVARSDLGDISRAELDQHILGLDGEFRKPRQGQDLGEWRREILESMLAMRALEREGRDLLESHPGIEHELTAMRRELLHEAFETEVVQARAAVSEEDLRRFYDENPEEFGHPAQIRLSHIYRRVDRDASAADRAAAKAEMEALLEDIRNGASFGEMAREHSDSETARLNGLIGRLSRGQLDPALEEIVWNLEEGEVTEVITNPVGFHIFMLNKHIEPFKMEFSEAEGRLRRRLEGERVEQVRADLFVELLEESGALYRPESLESMDQLSPDEPLFALGDTLIKAEAVDQYLEITPLPDERELPPAEWLELAARFHLFVWKAEQMDLAARPEIQGRFESAKGDFFATIALRERIRAEIQRLEDEGVLLEYYMEKAQRFERPQLFHLHMILKTFDGLDRPYDAYELLDRMVDDLRSGRRDFGDTAREISDDISARFGGDLGWVHLRYFGDWAGHEAQRTVRKTPVGEISDPILIERYDTKLLKYIREGYALVRVDEIREAESRQYVDAKEQVADAYYEAHRGTLERQAIEAVLAEINTRILEERL